MKKYILNEKGKPVEEADLFKWAAWFENAREQRIVAKTQIGDLLVSTVFLGMDYSFEKSSVPILYETMVFVGSDISKEHPDGFNRYATWDEALAGHHEICKKVSESGDK